MKTQQQGAVYRPREAFARSPLCGALLLDFQPPDSEKRILVVDEPQLLELTGLAAASPFVHPAPTNPLFPFC